MSRCSSAHVLEVGCLCLETALDHLTRGTVDGDPVALVDLVIVDSHEPLVEVDLELLGADDGRLAELAGDERCVTGSPTARGEDPVGGEHAVDIVRLRLRTNHDHVPALVFGPSLRQVGIERHDADGGAGRYVQCGGEEATLILCRLLRRGDE